MQLTVILSLIRSANDGLPFFWLFGFKGVVESTLSVDSISIESFFPLSMSLLGWAGKANAVFFLRGVLHNQEKY